MTIAAVVTAAGYGVRLGSEVPKALVFVRSRPLVAWALDHVWPLVDTIVVTAPPTHVKEMKAAAKLSAAGGGKVRVIAGGDTRQGSVALALDALYDGTTPQPSTILIHDAARAFMPAAVTQATIEAIDAGADGAVPLLALADTIVLAPASDGELTEGVDRTTLRAVQTPQAFAAAALRDSHLGAARDGLSEATDDASLLRRYGYRVVGVDGHARGRKITDESDLAWAEAVSGVVEQEQR